MKFARTTTVTGSIDKIAEITSVWEQSILPALKPVAGYEGAYLLIDPSTGEGVSLTFWASEQDAIAYEKSGLYTKLVESLRPFFTTRPTLRSYQVTAEAPSPAAAIR